MAHRYKERFPEVHSAEIMKLVYDDGDLRIEGLDRNRSQVIGLRFRDVLLTRIAPEGVRLRLLPELGTQRGLVLTDEQSELTSWVLEEGLGTRNMRDAKHFMVRIGEEIVDVVALSDLEVTKGPTIPRD